MPEGDDYASRLLGDAWDMEELRDIYYEKSQGVTDLGITDGILHGRTTSDDPGLYLLWPGYGDGLPNVGRYGVNYPIDADHYTRLSFRLHADQDGNGAVLWFKDVDLTKGRFGAPFSFRVYPGWRVYTFDLPSLALDEGDLAWGGLIRGLRLDPINQPGSTFQLDWVRLTGDTDNSQFTIPWLSTPKAGIVNLYSDNDSQWENGIYAPITTSLGATPAAYTWQTAELPGGDYYVVAESSADYAALVLGDSWDMDGTSDVNNAHYLRNAQFQDGIYSFESETIIPYFWPSYDHRTPIDTQRYTYLVLRMFSSQADFWRPSWWGMDEEPYDLSEDPLPTLAGWHTYWVDLRQSPDWTGLVRNLVIRPAYAADIEIKFDWIALTPGLLVTDESGLAVARTYSPGPLTIRPASQVQITQPSMSSGEDYATVTFGHPWDMAASRDLDGDVDLFEINFNQDMLQAQSGATGDAQIFLNTGGFTTTTPIDAQKYKYLTYRLRVEGKQDTVYGWVARLIWWGSLGVVTHKDVVVNEGWNTYQIDLSHTETDIPSGWGGFVSALRMDPHEIPAPTNFQLDHVYLRAPDQADTQFDVRWEPLANPEIGVDKMVNLYYDTDQDPALISPLAAGLAMTVGHYLWDTTPVPEGDYYLYAETWDGLNRVGRYSQTPVEIRHPLAKSRSAAHDALTYPPIPQQFVRSFQQSETAPMLNWTGASSLERVTALATQGETIWVGTRGGLLQWHAPTAVYTHTTTLGGLPDNRITALTLQNSTLWVGTEDGLARFQNGRWTHYTTADGLPDNRITALAQSQGILWVGSYGGVSRLAQGVWTHFTRRDGLGDNLVRSITPTGSGQIWVGSDGGGISRYNGASWQSWLKEDGLAGNHVWASAVDQSGRLWVGSYSGLSAYQAGSWTTTGIGDGLPDTYIRGLLAVGSDLWAATAQGIGRYTGGSWTTFGDILPPGWSQALAVDAQGGIWAGLNNSLLHFDGGEWRTYPLPSLLPNNYVPAMAQAPDGAVWLATFGGAVRYDGAIWSQLTQADGLPSNQVQALAFGPGDTLWVGTDQGLARRLNGNWTIFTPQNTGPNGLIHANITALMVDRENRLWVGTWLGVSVFDGQSWVSYLVEDGLADFYVFDMVQDRQGAVWVATLDGVSRILDGTITNFKTQDGLLDNRVRSLDIDSQGRLLFATHLGISRYDGETWRHWTLESGGNPLPVWQLAADGERIWAATYGGGVSYFDGDSWSQWTRAQGLASAYSLSIFVDRQRRVWTGGMRGVNWSPIRTDLFLPMMMTNDSQIRH